MKKTLIAFVFIFVFSASAFSSDTIEVIIDYGGSGKAETHKLEFNEGDTVLMALQKTAVVETHPVGGYIFVTSVNGVKGVRGETAWYYEVNGKNAKVVASSNTITPDMKTVKWKYEEDVCSKTVDKVRGK